MTSSVRTRQARKVTILELSGRIVVGEAADQLGQALQDCIAAGHLDLLLECSQVSYIDSQGIQVLVRGVISIERRGGKLKLLKLSPRVREVLNITRLLTVIESFEDEGAALRSFES